MEVEHRKGFSKNVWTGKTDHSCPSCGILLPADVPKGQLCPACIEMNLFADVREFIRTHDVNEYEVAIHFGIPRSKVKQWIIEGRIEYKDDGQKYLAKGHCQMCGAPVTFGNLCAACNKRLEEKKKQGFATIKPSEEDVRMRFI